ncbi:MAG: hypothetical protein HQK54_09180, partial [Oligoflexales bacterium]|nr:hypothetical protein [Oligoflexales bacterium]
MSAVRKKTYFFVFIFIYGSLLLASAGPRDESSADGGDFKNEYVEVKGSSDFQRRIEIWFRETSARMPRVILSDNDKRLKLAKYTGYLEDPLKNIKIEDIVKGSEENPKWNIHQSDRVPSFGYSKSAYWLRYLIENHCGTISRFFLELDFSFFSYVDLYLISPDGKVKKMAVGSKYPYYNRPIDYRNFVFPLDLPKGTPFLILVRGESLNSLVFSFDVYQPEHFYSTVSNENLFFGIYYGMCLVMLLYNIFLFISIRDVSYLVYVFWVATYMLFQGSVNGLTFKYLWPDNTFLSIYNMGLTLSVGDFCFCLFSQIFLETKQRHKTINRLINILFKPLSIAMFASALFGLEESIHFLALFNSSFALFFLIVGIISVAKGFRPARFYVLAFVIIFFGGILFGVAALGFLPVNNMTEYCVQVGSAAEIVLLSFALGDKISLRQKEAMDLINNLNTNLNDLNANLELKVKEQTSELREANVKLQDVDRLKTNFFQNISHELRTPLTLILNPLKSLREKYPKESEIKVAIHNSNRLYRLVNQLLDFQKLSSK